MRKGEWACSGWHDATGIAQLVREEEMRGAFTAGSEEGERKDSHRCIASEFILLSLCEEREKAVTPTNVRRGAAEMAAWPGLGAR